MALSRMPMMAANAKPERCMEPIAMESLAPYFFHTYGDDEDKCSNDNVSHLHKVDVCFHYVADTDRGNHAVEDE